ncbi:peptide chain release factor N(5)-glutamine methyltransferase [Rhodospirillum centenum]|uniref:Release factor glutamine methyltransferase n=1 Tax=Rhodospirillum centenum (strain ATCC 51521 / SW) TaxID=414684 RepID=B6IUS9_RHOCS|nr:peptide chain release factor N(5)-glutamine methyltransferase [Rhodospirillum centenum]ACJ00011.1 modification methylase,hemK family [Rhodospirillum centenum SW]
MATLSDLLREAAARLAAAGVDSPRLDAEYLAEAAFGLPRAALRRHGTDSPEAAAASRFAALVARRAAREPLQRLLGSWEFWGLDLTLAPDTLIPRPDTETVVEAVLRRRPDRTAPLRLLDLGTGSGAILLALLSEYPRATGLGVDLSPAAAATAALNARRLGLSGRARFLAGSWAAALGEAARFDVVVGNPPYIPDDEIDGLEPEVARHEPRRALAGGADGLDCYRAIAAELPRLLLPGGLAVLEHGADQASAVAALLEAAGLGPVGTVRDLAGRDRAAIAQAAPTPAITSE